MSLGQAAPNLGSIAAARGAGGKVIEIIKRVSSHLYCLCEIGELMHFVIVIVKEASTQPLS